MNDVAELLEIARDLARSAGAVVRDRPTDLHARSKSTPTDAVTVVDAAAERVIVDGLKRLRPHDRIVAEEGGDSATSAEVTWYVDPLDGTVNYLYGLPPYAVSIAAAVDREPVAGAVLEVSRDELYLASRGGGATCNGRPLRCTEQTDPAMALLATGFAYDADVRAWQASVVAEVLPQVRDVRRAGAAAIDLCHVAAGRVDAYYEAGMHPWDWMAGSLIAREAGARVAGLGGRGPGRNVTLAANPALFDALEKILLEAGAGDRTLAS
jgi:myo-inositol-1(or 4)-monophosphatase